MEFSTEVTRRMFLEALNAKIQFMEFLSKVANKVVKLIDGMVK